LGEIATQIREAMQETVNEFSTFKAGMLLKKKEKVNRQPVASQNVTETKRLTLFKGGTMPQGA